MKKIILILVTLFTISCGQDKQIIGIPTNGDPVIINGCSIIVVDYSGHEYLVFHTGGYNGSVIHSESCKYCKNTD